MSFLFSPRPTPWLPMNVPISKNRFTPHSCFSYGVFIERATTLSIHNQLAIPVLYLISLLFFSKYEIKHFYLKLIQWLSTWFHQWMWMQESLTNRLVSKPQSCLSKTDSLTICLLLSIKYTILEYSWMDRTKDCYILKTATGSQWNCSAQD